MRAQDLARELNKLGKLAPSSRAAENARVKRRLEAAGLKRVTYRMPLTALEQVSILQRKLGLEYPNDVIEAAVLALAEKHRDLP